MEAHTKYQIVDQDKEFRFKNLCPYCGEDLIYNPTGWVQDDDGLWELDLYDKTCVSMPDIESPKFKEWVDQHTVMPYVYQLPIDLQVEHYINSKYRFNVK